MPATRALPDRLGRLLRTVAILATVVLLAIFVPVAAGASVAPALALASAPAACQQAPTPGKAIPPLAPRDPLITKLGLDQAWALTTGAGVTVGVVDTGVDAASPKLAAAVEVGESLHVVDTPAVYAVAADGRSDCDGHGTEIAALIAGRTAAGDDRVSGVAPSARIYPVQIRGEIAQAPSALIAAAIRIAAQHAQVINLSFAQTTDAPDIRAAIKYAVGRDVVVVAASANEGTPAPSGGAPHWYPAAYPGVLSVTSVDADGVPDSGSTGDWIKIAAPGDALTTVPRGGKDYVAVTGTSFATAIVSGCAALLRSRFPELTASEVTSRLEQTALPPGDGSRDQQVGYGIVDPFAALTERPGPSSVATGTPGRVAVPSIRPARGGASSAGVLGLTAALGALAALVGVATVSVRSGRRRLVSGPAPAIGRRRARGRAPPGRTGLSGTWPIWPPANAARSRPVDHPDPGLPRSPEVAGSAWSSSNDP